MNSTQRIAIAVLAGAGTLFLAGYMRGISLHRQKRVNRKLEKHAVHEWEGEGGALVNTVSRPMAS